MKDHDIIKSEAREFYNYGDWRSRYPFPKTQDFNAELKLLLKNFKEVDQIIFLEEVSRLIDISSEEHLKICLKLDNPDDCYNHQLNAKNKFYVEQLLELDNLQVRKNVLPNDQISEETLTVMNDLLEGRKYSVTKDTPNEISEIIKRLSSMGILTKATKYSYAVLLDKRRYLIKLMELKSWNDFMTWIDKNSEEKPNAIIHSHIYGNNSTSNIAVGDNITQNVSKIYNEDVKKILSALNELGVPDEDLREVEEIITKETDKSKIGKRLLEWAGRMTSKAIEKGIELKVPAVLEKLQELM